MHFSAATERLQVILQNFYLFLVHFIAYLHLKLCCAESSGDGERVNLSLLLGDEVRVSSDRFLDSLHEKCLWIVIENMKLSISLLSQAQGDFADPCTNTYIHTYIHTYMLSLIYMCG